MSPRPAEQGQIGSDLIAELLDRLGIGFAALNPGASIRGLHESLVHRGRPEVVLTLHEEVAVAVAHGYFKAAGKPMAVLLHDLVGLQHAAIGLFNAWVDQTPMVALGGSGPADATRRRPWIDWIHAPRWPGLAVRDIVKWDDQPVSIEGVLSSVMRAYGLALAHPQGPSFVAIDALLQEERARVALPDPREADPGSTLTAPHGDLERSVALLTKAERPVVLADLTGRSAAGYQALVDLAEVLASPVVDLGGRHNFATSHWADMTEARAEVLADADVILAVDVRDLRWALSDIDLETHGSKMLVPDQVQVISMGLGQLLHRGFLDREGAGTADLVLTADSSVALPVLVDLLRGQIPPRVLADREAALRDKSTRLRQTLASRARQAWDLTPISSARVAGELWPLVQDGPWIVANGTLSGWARRLWEWDRFGCYLGRSGGEGLGYGAGASIGAALACRENDTLVVDLQSDGDLLYTASALWTAAHYRLPILFVVENNRTYGKDRLHQATMARLRGRGQELVHVGIDIDDPPVDFAKLAEAQGVEGVGPVLEPAGLRDALAQAVAAVREKRPALVDVVVARG